MKQWFCIFAIILILFPFSACHSATVDDPLVFYYLRKNDTFDSDDSVIAAEIVEGSRYQHISQMLNAYLQGPRDPALESPFPSGTYLVNTQMTGGVLVITLSKEFAKLTGVSLSLACCALAKTAIEFSGTEAVQIQTLYAPLDGDASILIRASDILLYDNYTIPADSTDE